MDDQRETEQQQSPCGFVFLPSYYESLKDLRAADRQAILEAIFQYTLRGALPTLNPLRMAVFNALKPVLDNSMKRYRANVLNGRKGGRPPRWQRRTPLLNEEEKNGGEDAENCEEEPYVLPEPIECYYK